MVASDKKIKKWISSLTDDQKNQVIDRLLTYSMDSELINFYEDDECLEPYYDCTGESLADED